MNEKIVTIYQSLIMSKLTTQFHSLVGSQIMHSSFLWTKYYNMVVSLRCAKIIQSKIIAGSPQGIFTQALITVKDIIQHEKESTGKHRKVESFQAQLPGSFMQDVLPLHNMNCQDTCKLLCSQENQGMSFLRSFYTPLICKKR